MEIVRTRQVEGPLPLFDHRPSTAWVSPALSLVGWGEAFRITLNSRNHFRGAAQAISDWLQTVEVVDEVAVPGSGPVAFASFTFDPTSSGSVVVIPEVLFGNRDGRWFITTVGSADPSPLCHPAGTGDAEYDRPRYAGSSVPDVAWLEAVAEALERIGSGAVEKVVLARDYAVWSKARLDPRRLLTNLNSRFDECFTFLIEGLVGASPELLARKHGRRVESVALAGSAPRGRDHFDDELLGKELMTSDKNLREHEMTAASVGRVLGEYCERLARDAQPQLLRLENVQHLATQFHGVLGPDTGLLDLVSRLHPTAAVGGVPTQAALELIRELEGMDRERYAGPVGWVDARGDGEFAIALRCAELSGARARLFAGAGIVAGSLPEVELEETRLKLLAMLAAL